MAQYDIAGLKESLSSSTRKKSLIERTALICALGSGMLLSFFAYFLLDFMTDFPWPVRLLVTLGILACFLFHLPRRHRSYFQRVTNVIEMARKIELLADRQLKGGFNSILVSAVEFAELNIVYGSEALKHLAVQNAHSQEYNPSKLVLHDRKLVSLAVKLLLAFTVIYAAWGAVSFKSMGIFFGRSIGLPLQYPTRTKILKVTCPEFAAQHRSVAISVEAGGKVPSEGKLVVAYEGESSFNVPLAKSDRPNCFDAEIKEPDKTFSFKVRLGDAESRKFTVRINRAPYVAESAFTLTPPNYTGQQVKNFSMGNFEALENSRLTINIVPDRQVKSCILEFKEKSDQGQTEFPMIPSQKGFVSDTINIKSSRTYSIKLVDDNGIANDDRIYYTMSVIADRLPVVKLERPVHGTYYAPVSRMNWSMKLSDDYGLASAALHYVVSVKNEGGDEKKIKEGDIDTGALAKNAREASFSGILNLQELKLSPGMTVSFQALAKDVNSFRGKDDSGKSSVSTVNIVSPEELRVILDEERLGLNKMVNDLKDDMKHQIRVIEMIDRKK